MASDLGVERTSFFPAAVRDELTYSVCCAFHELSGFASKTETRRALYGDAVGTPDLAMLGAKLYPLLSHWTSATPATALSWLWEHTMYPLWGVFFEPHIHEAWLQRVSTGPGRGFARLSREANTRRFPGRFALCVECVREDISEFGRSAWRRSHQVLGVRYCYRHETILLTQCASCNGVLCPRPAFGLPQTLCPHCGRQLVAQAYQAPTQHKLSLRYAALVENVLNSAEGLAGRARLGEVGWSGRSVSEVADAIREGFGVEFLVQSGLEINVAPEQSWVSACMRGVSPSPVHRLILAACAGQHGLSVRAVHGSTVERSQHPPVSDPIEGAKFRTLARFGIVRALIRGDDHARISARYKVSKTEVGWLLRSWKALKERRASWRRRGCASSAARALKPIRKQPTAAISLAEFSRNADARLFQFGLLRALIRGDAVSILAGQYGLEGIQIEQLLSHWPDLNERRKKGGTRYRRLRLLALLCANPGTSRTDLAERGHGGLINALRSHDAEWLDLKLPNKHGVVRRDANVALDEALLQAAQSTEFLATARFRGTNSPWTFPAARFGTHFVRDLARGRFPKSAAFLASIGYVPKKITNE